jgi:hypothetical protein
MENGILEPVLKIEPEIWEYKSGTPAAIQHCSNILGSTFKHMLSVPNKASVPT